MRPCRLGFGFRREDKILAFRFEARPHLGGVKQRGIGRENVFTVVFVELEDDQGTTRRWRSRAVEPIYNESAKTVKAFLKRVDPNRLSFANAVASMDYLESVAPGNYAAKTAINLALLDAVGRHAGKPIYDLLNLGFTEERHVTSFSIGIDRPEIIRRKGSRS